MTFLYKGPTPNNWFNFTKIVELINLSLYQIQGQCLRHLCDVNIKALCHNNLLSDRGVRSLRTGEEKGQSWWRWIGFCGGRCQHAESLADQILVHLSSWGYGLQSTNEWMLEQSRRLNQAYIVWTRVFDIQFSTELTDRLCTRLHNTLVYRIVRLIHLLIYKLWTRSYLCFCYRVKF